jgi:hypothetical protein
MTGTSNRVSRAACWSLAVLAAVSSTVACTPGKPRVADRPAKPSAWQAVLDRIGPDGAVDLPTALAAFALAVGPVPGAPAPAKQQEPIPSGTLAVSWVLAHWADLSAEQREAVRHDLGALAQSAQPAPPAGSVQPAQSVQPAPPAKPARYTHAALEAPAAPATGSQPDLACLAGDSAGAAPYRAQLAGIESELTAHLGRPLKIADHVVVSVNSADLEHGALMYAWACDGSAIAAGTVTGCTIHVNPRAVNGHFTDAELRSFLIHEVMHCYLYDRFGRAYDTMPAWYVEGAPTYAMSALGTSSLRLSGIWKDYLDAPAKPLSQRAYDGLGFFVHLAESGTDVWKVIDPIGAAMLGAGTAGTPAGWAAAGVSQRFLDTWGSSFVQGRYPGAAWTSTGPNLPRYEPPIPDGRLSDGTAVTVAVKPFAAAVERIEVDATVVLVSPSAGSSGRLTLGGGAEGPLGGGPYCVIATCACPAGSPGAGAVFAPMAGGGAYAAVTGGAGPGAVTLTGQALPDFCAKPARSCLVGQWTSVGFDVSAGPITESGGSGVRMHIDPAGATTVVFDGMAPVRFTASTSGTATAGQFTYAGTITGTLRLPPATSASGNWEEVGSATAGGITADIQLVSPFSYHLGPLNVGQLANSMAGAGGAVGSPQLTSGSWRCAGDTLVSTPPAGGAVTGTWTLTRTGPG